jgi:O-antigen/teichoic acid export membrane protein
VSFEGSLKPKLVRVLDALRLTVVGLLLTVGLTVGLGIGFGIGGYTGAVVGTLSGAVVPLALAYAFRRHRTRNWLAQVADWVIHPDD